MKCPTIVIGAGKHLGRSALRPAVFRACFASSIWKALSGSHCSTSKDAYIIHHVIRGGFGFQTKRDQTQSFAHHSREYNAPENFSSIVKSRHGAQFPEGPQGNPIGVKLCGAGPLSQSSPKDAGAIQFDRVFADRGRSCPMRHPSKRAPCGHFSHCGDSGVFSAGCRP